MPILIQKKSENLLIGVWSLTETVDELSRELLIPSFLGDRFASFTSETRRLEFLAVRVLLKKLCGEEKEVLYYPSGRPYLKDGSFFITISHTKGYVAVALHTHSPVGIDIEYLSQRVERVASRFIRSDEVLNLPTVDRIKALLLYWSAKETAFKLLDEEGVDWRDHLRVHPFEMEEEGTLLLSEYKTVLQQEFKVDYWVSAEFVLTWSVKL
ncbi:MAG: 4'-phosphopantetheinyl transferase family protein [Phocaeicola sp.]